MLQWVQSPVLLSHLLHPRLSTVHEAQAPKPSLYWVEAHGVHTMSEVWANPAAHREQVSLSLHSTQLLGQ
jgi:hypothetical protein